MLLAGASLAFADGEVAPEIEREISSALDQAGSGYTDVRVLSEETVNGQNCYRIAFNDQGSDVELVLNKETFSPCEGALMNEHAPYVPVWNPGLWAAVNSSIISSSLYPYRYNRYRRHGYYRSGYDRPCRRHCRR